MHGTRKQLRKTNLSAVSNGARLFADRLDLRTPRGRRFKDLIASYSDDVGGKPTEAQRAIIRDLAMCQVMSEDLQATFLDTGKIDNAQHSRLSHLIAKHMRALGLIGRMVKSDDDEDEDDIDPLTYARSHRRRNRLNTDDDEGDD
jgi:hypothetical protein